MVEEGGAPFGNIRALVLYLGGGALVLACCMEGFKSGGLYLQSIGDDADLMVYMGIDVFADGIRGS